MRISLFIDGLNKAHLDGVYTPKSTVELAEVIDASCEEIHAQDCLDFMKDDDKLLQILKKIRYNGEVTFTGVDLLEVSRQIFTGQLTIQQANAFLYGNGRLSSTDLNTFVGVLGNYGFKVTLKRHITPQQYSITAVRNARS